METTVNGMKFRIFSDENAVYFDMALTMLEGIQKRNKKGLPTVMIVPVGPTAQYGMLAQMVNRLGVSLKNVSFFNMDEYLISPYEVIPRDDPLSFHGRMKREFYDLVDPSLVMPEEQRRFPEIGRETEYDSRLAALGNADFCFGGLGINGHIAFNEPPEPEEGVSADRFAAFGTRVLKITRETRTINAYGYNRGDFRGMPEWCITVGMKQILSSGKIYIALNRPWQSGALKRLLYGEETPLVPASLLRRHPDVTFAATEEIVNGVLPSEKG